MRSSSFVALSLIAVAACSGAPEPAPVVVASASGAPVAPPAEPAVEPTLPHAASLSGAIDLGAIDANLADMLRALSPILVDDFGLKPDQIAGGLRGLGVDASRPALFAVIAPQQDEIRAIGALPPPPTGSNGSSETLASMRKAVASLKAPFAVRVILPVIDANTTKRLITALLEKQRFLSHPGGVYIRSKELIALTGNDRSLAIDLVAGNEADAGLAALRADAANASASDVPMLEGRLFRVVYSPRALAIHGIVSGLVRTVAALSGASIDPSQAARVAGVGLAELLQWKTITESASGPYIERVDLGLSRHDDKGEITARLETGAGWTFGADEIWKPSPSIRIPSAKAMLDVSTKFLDAIPMPPIEAGKGTPFEQFARDAREAGSALPVIAPHLLLASLREPFDHPIFAVPASKLGFDRVGVYASEAVLVVEHPAFFGLLPDKTTRAAAECALVGKAPCPAKSRLKLDATVQVDHAFARLTRAGDRFVVLVADDKNAASVKVEPAVAGPAIADGMIGGFLAGEVHLPKQLRAVDHVHASVERDGKTIVIRAQAL